MYGFGYSGAMMGRGGAGIFALPFAIQTLIQIVILVDLILIGLLIWKKINKK